MATKYPDTAAGAKEFIRKESTLTVTEETTCFPDPSVEGVWKVCNLIDRKKTKRSSAVIVDAIIYMAGYKDPFKRVREYNDFEVGDVR